MRESTIFVPELTSPLINQALNQTQTLWGGGQSLMQRELALQQIFQLSSKPPLRLSGLMDSDGKLVCSLKCYTLSIKTTSQAIPAIGLGAIFTEENHRRKGFAKELVDKVTALAQSQGFKACLLFSDISPHYYARMGFSPLSSLQYRVDTDSIAETAQVLSIHKATETDKQSLIHWYRSQFTKEILHPHRDAQTWQLTRLLHPDAHDYVLVHEKKEVGYFTVSRSPLEMWVDEWVVPTELLGPFWTKVKRMAEKRRLGYVCSWLRPDIPGNQAHMLVSERHKQIAMIKTLDSQPQDWESQNLRLSSMDHF